MRGCSDPSVYISKIRRTRRAGVKVVVLASQVSRAVAIAQVSTKYSVCRFFAYCCAPQPLRLLRDLTLSYFTASLC